MRRTVTFCVFFLRWNKTVLFQSYFSFISHVRAALQILIMNVCMYIRIRILFCFQPSGLKFILRYLPDGVELPPADWMRSCARWLEARACVSFQMHSVVATWSQSVCVGVITQVFLSHAERALANNSRTIVRALLGVVEIERDGG